MVVGVFACTVCGWFLEWLNLFFYLFFMLEDGVPGMADYMLFVGGSWFGMGDLSLNG